MSRLDKIRIAGYKSIRDQTIELGPLNVLIGANGAGKSNFIEVFRLLNHIVKSELQIFVAKGGGADRMLHYGRKATEAIILHLHFGANAYSCLLYPTIEDSLVFEFETVYFQGTSYDQPYSHSLGSGHKETLLHEDSESRSRSTISGYVLSAFFDWRLYHFHDTSESSKIKQTGDIGDNEYLRQDAGNLAAFLYLLRETEPESYGAITDTIRLVAPFFGDFNLRPDRLNPNKIRLEWNEKGSDAYFDASSLSDGTLRFICMATLLLQPKLPSTILLDEPELGLHPYAVAVLSDLLASAAERTQVVVSTQSVTLVNQFSPKDVIVVDRLEGESRFRRLKSEEIASWLDDYALGDLWEKNVIGGRPSH